MRLFNRITTKFACLIALTCSLAATSSVQAQDSIPELVVTGLNNPTGVAVQPKTGHVFVADSGALRIVRVVDRKIEPVIINFPKDTYGKGPSYDIGPLGLLFLDEHTLVVGGGGQPDGQDEVRVYKIPDRGGELVDAADSSGKSFTLEKDGQTPGEGNFYALAKGATGIFVTCNGDDEQGWVSKATLGGNLDLKKFERAIATKKATGVDAPVGITISPQGYVTVGQMGEINDETDSLLTFYSEAGVLLGKYKTGLHDITGLAYGPKHGRLFALDFHWANTKEGGLYKLVDAKNDTKCTAVLMTELEKPTALAFNGDGDCYITLAGSGDSKKDDGKLIIVRSLDIDINE